MIQTTLDDYVDTDAASETPPGIPPGPDPLDDPPEWHREDPVEINPYTEAGAVGVPADVVKTPAELMGYDDDAEEVGDDA